MKNLLTEDEKKQIKDMHSLDESLFSDLIDKIKSSDTVQNIKKKFEDLLGVKIGGDEKEGKETELTGSNKYILGKSTNIDKNGPANHGTRAFGNWQSDNATDIFGKPGTVVHSITKGKVKKIGGNQDDHNGKVYGAQVTVTGTDGYPDIFYTHLQSLKVSEGDTVELGTPIGEISKWEDSPPTSHVHVGLPYGKKLGDLIDLNSGEIKI